jgi:transposase
MSKRIVQRKKEGKWVGRLVEGDKVYIGLDVHKKTVFAALRVNGVNVKTWSMRYDIEVILASLEPYRQYLSGVVYEAGPTGYTLARALKAKGIAVTVIAPSKTPKRQGEAKSDRLDCRNLAEYFANGQLREVVVPTEQQEADRQVYRAREQCISKVRRVKQQIKSLLMQYGVAEPAGLDKWSAASKEALTALKLRAELRFCLDQHLTELAYQEEELGRIEGKLRDLAETKRHKKAMAEVDAHVGVGPITTAAVTLQLFDPTRFRGSRQVTSFVGLAPRVSQSGETRREGGISKTGRAALRAMLIEASWLWIRKDPAAAKVFERLARNTGSRRKAIVGMARRLVIELWKRLCRAASSGQDKTSGTACVA